MSHQMQILFNLSGLHSQQDCTKYQKERDSLARNTICTNREPPDNQSARLKGSVLTVLHQTLHTFLLGELFNNLQRLSSIQFQVTDSCVRGQQLDVTALLQIYTRRLTGSNDSANPFLPFPSPHSYIPVCLCHSVCGVYLVPRYEYILTILRFLSYAQHISQHLTIYG